MPQSPDEGGNPAVLRVVIPAHDEETRIVPTLEEYCSVFRGLGTIVVVANGCSDGTAGVVRALQTRFDNLALIDVPSAIGKGGAVRVGLSTGSEPYAGFADADGSTSAAEFKRLFEVLQTSNADAVVGSRWLADSRVAAAQSGVRRTASRTFNAVVRALFALPIRDTQCGAKLFRRSALDRILSSLELADFAFDIELLVSLQRCGCRILEVPTVWSDRARGSKIQLARASWTMLKSVLRLRLRDTALWRVPLVDRFGSRGVIPVKAGRRVLILGAPDADDALSADVARFAAGLRAAGIEPVFAEAEARKARLSPWATFAWYALRSRRDYDALVEIAIRRNWIIPRFSAKPTFVIAGHRERSLRGHARVRSVFVDLAAGDARAAVDVVRATVYSETAYPVGFVETPQGLALHFADRKTGTRTTHMLG
ncbi:MAG: glycosyltransferase [Candidatus Eremiobacteraeota bacterium]|nr:glycosyltransferase [Candidatus Eremiobacteraeota bacterium]